MRKAYKVKPFRLFPTPFRIPSERLQQWMTDAHLRDKNVHIFVKAVKDKGYLVTALGKGSSPPLPSAQAENARLYLNSMHVMDMYWFV